jgi:hypothetical protein
VASIVLHATDRLNGPTFWDEGPALVEAILFSVVAAAWGLRVATRSEPGLLGRLTT